MKKTDPRALRKLAGGVSDDGKIADIKLENYDGETFSFVMDATSLSRTVEFLLNLAVKSGELFAPEEKRVSELTAIPIPTAQLAVARGRTDREALLVFQVGILQVTFATELGKLSQICDDLRAKTKSVPPSLTQ